MATFEGLKVSLLSGLDLSPKGSWDAPLLDLLDRINAHPDHASSSSCSGRIALYATAQLAVSASESGSAGQQQDLGGSAGLSSSLSSKEEQGYSKKKEHRTGKGTGTWLYSTHEFAPSMSNATDADLLQLLFPSSSPCGGHDDGGQQRKRRRIHLAAPKRLPEETSTVATLKFEPMVLHLTSRSLAHSVVLLQAALATGHRNSGIVLPASYASDANANANANANAQRKKGRQKSMAHQRVNLAIRSSGMGIDVPIAFLLPSSAPSPEQEEAQQGVEEEEEWQLLVSPSYIRHLLEQCNSRQRANFERIEKLTRAFREALAPPNGAGAGEGENEEDKVDEEVEESREERWERKKREGLIRQEAARQRREEAALAEIEDGTSDRE